MGIREQLNEHPSVVTAVTAGVLVLALIYMASQLGLFGGGGPSTEVWYLEDGEIVEGDYSEFLDPASKKVIAHQVVPADGGEPVVWYYERNMAESVEAGFPMSEIRLPNAERWVPMESNIGMQVMERVPTDDQGRPMVPYRP